MKKWFTLAGLLILLGGIVFIMTACGNNWSFKTIFSGKDEERVTDISEDFNGIDILTDTADISLLPSEDGNRKIVVNDKKNIKYNVSVENGILKINSVDERKWYERMFTFGGASLVVYLPEGEYASLAINESTGDITVPSDFKFGNIDIRLSTGHTRLYASATESVKINGSTGGVTVENIACGSLEVKVSTGKITMNNVTCSGDITMKVSTGDAHINNINCKNLTSVGNTGDIKAENLTATENTSIERSTGCVSINNAECAGSLTTRTSTGKTEIFNANCADLSITVSTGKSNISDINCANFSSEGTTGSINMVNVIANGTFDIERGTGDVTFEGCDAAEIYVTTDTGNVKGTLLSEKIFVTQTDTGKVKVPESLSGGKCKITTDTGDIKIEIE